MMDMASDGDLPRGIALAWGVAANPQRGPKRELSLEGIVDAAVAIADADGLAAVSMASVASALGFTTMSLYRYVSAKDDLLLLMQETGMGQPPLSIEQADSWRDGLRRWYAAALDVYAGHPWLLDLPIDGATSTPNSLTWLDAGLGVLADTALSHSERVSAMLALSGQCRWEAQIRRGQEMEEVAPEQLAELITPEQFPFLAPALAAGAFSDGEADALEFGFLRILDGLEQFMQSVADGREAPTPKPDSDREFSKDEKVRQAASRVKEAEGKLRDARQKHREAIAKARERAEKTL
jgi:AcrR family transcriptional regulator